MALAVSGLAFSLMTGGRAVAADPPQYPPVTPTVTVTIPVPGPTVTITITPRPETPPGQIVSCAVKTVKNASRIKVNMGPNQPGNRYYTFRIEVLQPEDLDTWFRQLQKIVQDPGHQERRAPSTCPRASTRSKCYGKYGFTQTIPISSTIKIKK